MCGGLCGKRTSTITSINKCMADRQLLIALHQSIDLKARYSSKIVIFAYPTCIRRLVRGSPSEYRRNVWYGKIRMVWLYPMVKKFCRYIYSFDRIHERDGQTDGRTYTARRHRPRFCIASRGKNCRFHLTISCHRLVRCQSRGVAVVDANICRMDWMRRWTRWREQPRLRYDDSQ